MEDLEALAEGIDIARGRVHEPAGLVALVLLDNRNQRALHPVWVPAQDLLANSLPSSLGVNTLLVSKEGGNSLDRRVAGLVEDRLRSVRVEDGPREVGDVKLDTSCGDLLVLRLNELDLPLVVLESAGEVVGFSVDLGELLLDARLQSLLRGACALLLGLRGGLGSQAGLLLLLRLRAVPIDESGPCKP